MKKDKLIKLTKYSLNKKAKKDENETEIEENEENVKIYFVKHLISKNEDFSKVPQ